MHTYGQKNSTHNNMDKKEFKKGAKIFKKSAEGMGMKVQKEGSEYIAYPKGMKPASKINFKSFIKDIKGGVKDVAGMVSSKVKAKKKYGELIDTTARKNMVKGSGMSAEQLQESYISARKDMKKKYKGLK